MKVRTHFIETTDGSWIKDVPCLVPNLQEGQYAMTIDDQSHGYRKWRWRIDKIETIIEVETDTVLQNVYMTCCCREELWQEIMREKK